MADHSTALNAVQKGADHGRRRQLDRARAGRLKWLARSYGRRIGALRLPLECCVGPGSQGGPGADQWTKHPQHGPKRNWLVARISDRTPVRTITENAFCEIVTQ